MEIEITKKSKEKQEVKIPCFRQNELKIALIKEDGYVSLFKSGSAFSSFTSHYYVDEFFDDKSSEATKEEFQEALAKTTDTLLKIEQELCQ